MSTLSSIGRLQRLLLRAGLALLLACGIALVAPSGAQAAVTNVTLQGEFLRSDYSSARVCKTAVNSPYGPLWRYRFEMYKKDPHQRAAMHAQVLRDNRFWLDRVTNTQWWYGVGGSLYVYGSRLHDDQVQFTASNDGILSNHNRIGARSVYSPSQIATC